MPILVLGDDSKVEKEKSFSPIKRGNAFQRQATVMGIKNESRKIEQAFKKDIDNKLDLVNQYAKSSSSHNNNIKVYVRFRPFNEVEEELLESGVGFICVEYVYPENKNDLSQSNNSCEQEMECKAVQIKNTSGQLSHPYHFDKVFTTASEQEEIYGSFGKVIVKDVLDGYNGTVFAYGQSGSGKTFTMYGPDIYNDDYKGVIPRLIQDIFTVVNEGEDNVIFQFKMSY